MPKARIRYFEQEDVLHLVIADEPESRSIELLQYYSRIKR